MKLANREITPEEKAFIDAITKAQFLNKEQVDHLILVLSANELSVENLSQLLTGSKENSLSELTEMIRNSDYDREDLGDYLTDNIQLPTTIRGSDSESPDSSIGPADEREITPEEKVFIDAIIKAQFLNKEQVDHLILVLSTNELSVEYLSQLLTGSKENSLSELTDMINEHDYDREGLGDYLINNIQLSTTSRESDSESPDSSIGPADENLNFGARKSF